MKWSDELVEEVRIMHEDHKLGWRKLAKLFNVPKQTIRGWIYFETRTQHAARYVYAEEGK